MAKVKDKKAMRRTAARERMRRSAQKDANTTTVYALPAGIKEMPIKEGRNKISVVPFTVTVPNNLDEVPEGELWYRRKYWQHRNIGPNKNKVVCLRSFGKPCPICEEMRSMYDDPDIDDDAAKALSASPRLVFNTKYKGEIHLLDISVHCFGKMLNKELDEFDDDDDRWMFWDVEDGFDLKARFNLNTSLGKPGFHECDRIDFVERDDLDEEITKAAIDLDRLIKEPDYDELKKALFGVDEIDDDNSGEEEEESGEEESGVPVCPECGEGLDDCVCDEEEEEEKPKPKKRTGKKKKAEPGPEPENKCPIDAEFGVDWDEYNVCDDCPVAKACKAASPEADEDEGLGDDEEEEYPEPDVDDGADDEDEDDGKNECDYGTWADDCDTLDECDDCPRWTRCRDAKDAADLAAKSGKGKKKGGRKSRK